PAWGLARTPFGYVLLDPEGLAAWHLGVTSGWGASSPDILSRLQRKLSPAAQIAQSELRRLAAARCLPRGLARMLRAHLPQGVAYLNTGHSNLSERVLRAVRSLPHARIAVFVHDVIPIEFPQYQRAGSVEVFANKMRRVHKFADLILYNSEDTLRRTQSVMAPWGRVPKGIVAHLGTVPPAPNAAELPDGLPPERTYFVTVGTIEPRKNHAMLLDIWDRLGPDAPELLICGGRGWNNDAVFDRLDALGADARVREVSGLTDGGLMALIQGAHGMLFPSHAEGFGLPAIEALQLGTPVLCSNMAIFRETLAEKAFYIDDLDQEIWEKTVIDWSKQAQGGLRVDGFVAPTWADHFKIVLRYT
ncbi:MAG: glycosyltransferase family 1 protein, partial [Sulfitobacter sp.]